MGFGKRSGFSGRCLRGCSGNGVASPTQTGAFAIEAGARPKSVRRFTSYLVLAGLTNAAIAAFLLFNLPASREPSLRSLFIRALLFVGGAVLAGMAGSRFYWNRSSAALKAIAPLSFRRFVLVNAEAWVWVPAIVLLSRQDSPVCAVLCALGAALLSNGLRRALSRSIDLQDWRLHTSEFEKHEMFAATLQSPPREPQGYVIAFSIYLAGYLLIKHFDLIAGIPLALCAFLVVWHLTREPAPTTNNATVNPRAADRLASVTIAAFLVTLLVLMFGIAHRNRVEAASVPTARGGGEVNRRNSGKSAGAFVSGFESVILWPAPEKKKIVPPRLVNSSPLATRAAKPLVIHFDGAYWYFQPPDKHPGPNAHQTYGSPLVVDIGTNNFFPLTMEAVQRLNTAIRLAPYREIQVTVENRDNIPGPIALSVVLTDTTTPGKPSLSLGTESVLSSEPGSFTVKPAPTEEVLRFFVPEQSTTRKFDEITVFFLPDVAHFQVGPKIAIQQFVMVPR
jgi:hypothetical protein